MTELAPNGLTHTSGKPPKSYLWSLRQQRRDEAKHAALERLCASCVGYARQRGRGWVA